MDARQLGAAAAAAEAQDKNRNGRATLELVVAQHFGI